MTNVSSDTLKLLSRNDGMDTEVNVTSVVYNEATRTAVVTPETALSTGFSDSNYFIRYFRQKTGMTPKAYQLQNTK
jgi:AraC-like DNA-binding protein